MFLQNNYNHLIYQSDLPILFIVRNIIHPTKKVQLNFFNRKVLETGSVGWFKNPLSSQTEKLMAATKFSDYLGLNHYKKAKN